MKLPNAFAGWTSAQKHVVAASYLGWTLDAFDFFLLVFVIKDVAKSFGVGKEDVAVAIMLTLAFRAVGAFVFGRLADRFGRRPILMLDVALYSIFGFATAFAPNLNVFLLIRALFGVAMGGEWGIGASLTMESVRPESRGLVSGLLQSGYPSGYLLASVVYAVLYPEIGWRGLFMVGILPAFLIFYIRRRVPESPGWHEKVARLSVSLRGPEAGIVALYLVTLAAWFFLRPAYGNWIYLTGILPLVGTLLYFRRHWLVALFVVALMTGFNFFSHGTQDIYPTFLEVQHHFDAHLTGTIAVIYNIGAILGGWSFGALSQRYGRKRMIVTAALLAIPTAWLWAYSQTAVMLAAGAFLMQFFVQGAWGVVPAHLNELAPPDARGTFPGTIYQLGNFIASSNAVLQTGYAVGHGDNYSLALAAVAVLSAIAIAVLAALGPEARHIDMRAPVAAQGR
ncbi:MAG TPA: MFS transporter [Rhizomicrobium sp.]|nr:MFS transporter [Rhizomicrobium sp.]